MSDQLDGSRPEAALVIPGEVVPGGAESSYEIDLDEPGAAPQQAVPVDPAPPAVTRLPIVPAHLRTRKGIQATASRHAQALAHRGGFHGLRLPLYLVKALGWALVGVAVVVAQQVRWAWVLESHELRSDAVADGNGPEWRALHKAAQEARKVRLLVLGGEVVALVGGGVALARFGNWWIWALACLVALLVLASYGRPPDQRIVSQAVVAPRFRKLNGDIVLRAYYAAGLGHPEKPDQQVTFGGPMHRDGEGSRVLVDLPYGKGLKDAMNAKDDIASGLDVTESQVFLHRDPTSYRRHTLWVADRDPLAVPVGRTPLLAGKATDIWKPAPLGLDERGGLVTVPILWNSVLVGALPRQGKTFLARLLALYCALDPYAQLSVFDGKGSPDWRKFALVADSFAFGLTPTRQGLPPEILLTTLEKIKDDVQWRYNTLSELPTDICPHGKLTREIARNPKYKMPVRVLVLDEFQEYYELGDISKDIAALITFLTKVAPGAGVSLIGATQKPSGIGGGGQVGTMFTSARDNFAVRVSLRTSSWQVSEMVLGQGAYSEGLDSSTLLPQYKGVGILRGATDASPTVRSYLADGQDAEKILTAARAIRQRAGTLSGMALGEQDDVPAPSILTDVLAVLGDAPAMHWSAIGPLLAARFPDRHADCTPTSVRAQCDAAGIDSVDVKYLGRSAMGCRREHIQVVLRKAGL